MDALSTLRRRLVSQRLAGDPFDDVAEAVQWLGAVQAQEFDEAKWSLGERTRECADTDVEAAFARGDFIRTHALRPTWHFVVQRDVRWLLRLTRPRVHALNRYWYRKLGLDAELLARGHAVLARALKDGEARTRRELGERLALEGIEADGLRLGYLLMHAELEELICSGARRGKQQTYMLVDHRVPTSHLDDLSRERALGELLLRYFRSRGPATIKDFTAWSSHTVSDTKVGLERVRDELAVEEDEAGTAWYSARLRRSTPSPSAVRGFLIPMYDETIVAYKDLRVVLAHQPPRPGLLDRAIVIDGRTFGSWKRSITPRRVTVESTLFGPLAAAEARALDEAVVRFGRFLGREASLETGPAPSG